jgi:multiple sugar transport system ATP-binding protein
LDEPLSNLDPALRWEMRAELLRLHKQFGWTIIYVTHDQVEAMTLGQTLAVLKNGSLQQHGPPLELYDRPANRFVAGFLGSPGMNLIEGKLSGKAPSPSFQPFGDTGIHWEISVPACPAKFRSREMKENEIVNLVLGFRPEHCRIDPEPKSNLDTCLTFKATSQFYQCTGPETFVGLRIGETTLIAREAGARNGMAGTEITISVAPENIRWFDGETGVAI